MEDLENREVLTTEEYNAIPVHYCSTCLSLKVKILDPFVDYCDKCGSTDINETSIEEWKRMYKERYNKEF